MTLAWNIGILEEQSEQKLIIWVYLMWFNYVYLQKLSTDNELPPQMRREINQISRWLPNFGCKIDDQGVKIFYYDLWIALKLLKWRIASNSPKTTLVLISNKILNLVRRLLFFGRSAKKWVKGLSILFCQNKISLSY